LSLHLFQVFAELTEASLSESPVPFDEPRRVFELQRLSRLAGPLTSQRRTSSA
jgi:hypothetical protein